MSSGCIGLYLITSRRDHFCQTPSYPALSQGGNVIEPIWRLNIVLNALTRAPFKPVGEIGLKWLRMKTIFLVAVTSARRISELGALSRRNDLCIFHRDKVVLLTDPSFNPIVSSSFHRSQEIRLPSFCPYPKHSMEKKWHILDIRRSLKAFLLRTESLGKTDFMFINISPPNLGSKMLMAAIGSAIRTCIKEAYKSSNLDIPERITAHPTSNFSSLQKQNIYRRDTQGCHMVLSIYLYLPLQDPYLCFSGCCLWQKGFATGDC